MLRRLDFLLRSLVALSAGEAQGRPSIVVSVPGNGASDLSGEVEVKVGASPGKGIRSLWLQVDSLIVANTHVSPLLFLWNTTTWENGLHVLEGGVQFQNRKSAQDKLVVNVHNLKPKAGRVAAAGFVYLFGGGA